LKLMIGTQQRSLLHPGWIRDGTLDQKGDGEP
jgi:hypothetical protein